MVHDEAEILERGQRPRVHRPLRDTVFRKSTPPQNRQLIVLISTLCKESL